MFRIDEAPKLVGLSREVTRDRLKTLERQGWVKRLARGLYLLVPLEAGPQRIWTEDPAIIASKLVLPSYLSFWSALYFHSLTEQVPRVVTVATRRSHAPVEILGLRYLFTTLSARKFFGFEPTWVGHQQVPVATPEKAILDSLDHPERAGGVSEVAKAIVSLGSKLDSRRLLRYLARMKVGAVAKRLGYLLEILEVEKDLLVSVKLIFYTSVRRIGFQSGCPSMGFGLGTTVQVPCQTSWRNRGPARVPPTNCRRLRR